MEKKEEKKKKERKQQQRQQQQQQHFFQTVLSVRYIKMYKVTTTFYFNLRLPTEFILRIPRLSKWMVVNTLPEIFNIKTQILIILVPMDCFGPPLSVDAKMYDSSPSFDAIMMFQIKSESQHIDFRDFHWK